MSNEAVALIGFVCLFALMLLRVPVGMAMGLVGITGFGYLTGFAPALKLPQSLGDLRIRNVHGDVRIDVRGGRAGTIGLRPR